MKTRMLRANISEKYVLISSEVVTIEYNFQKNHRSGIIVGNNLVQFKIKS